MICAAAGAAATTACSCLCRAGRHPRSRWQVGRQLPRRCHQVRPGLGSEAAQQRLVAAGVQPVQRPHHLRQRLGCQTGHLALGLRVGGQAGASGGRVARGARHATLAPWQQAAAAATRRPEAGPSEGDGSQRTHRLGLLHRRRQQRPPCATPFMLCSTSHAMPRTCSTNATIQSAAGRQSRAARDHSICASCGACRSSSLRAAGNEGWAAWGGLLGAGGRAGASASCACWARKRALPPSLGEQAGDTVAVQPRWHRALLPRHTKLEHAHAVAWGGRAGNHARAAPTCAAPGP